MNPPTEDIKDILTTDTGLVFADDLFIGAEPSSPNNVVTLYDTGGGGFDLASYREPTIQARIRNTSYPKGWNQADEVARTLQTVNGRKVNGTHYGSIWLQSEILFVERDDDGRFVFTCNFRMKRVPI